MEKSDTCYIYLHLEVRSGQNTKRLAAGRFRSEDTVPDLPELNVNQTYGQLLDEAQDFTKSKDTQYVGRDSVDFMSPTLDICGCIKLQ